MIVPDRPWEWGDDLSVSSRPGDGSAVALVQDTLDLADELGLRRFAVVDHDRGARVAYGLAPLAPERVTSIAAPALDY